MQCSSPISIVVNVDHARAWRGGLRDLVRVVRRWYAGADVEELPYPGLGRQKPDRPRQERPVAANAGQQPRVSLGRLLRRRPVGREMVLPAEPVVVHTGDVRYGDVKVPHRSLVILRVILSSPASSHQPASRV
jgi:hypothetical protein